MSPRKRTCPAPRTAVLIAAAAIDVVFGEPPNRFHPVAWLGWMAAAAEWRLPLRPAFPALLAGGGLVAGIGASALAAGFTIERLGRSRPAIATPLAAVGLKSLFAYRALDGAVRTVEEALAAGDLDGARRRLAALVSRPSATLSAEHVASAAIESAAENLTDSVVGPLLAFAIGGLPAAALYRAVNTLDAMVGYHGEYEYLGKASARADDALNAIPARLAGGLIAVSAGFGSGSPRDALDTMLREHRRTESPNAGWTMAAMAGGLGIWLEKPGHYRLNPAGRSPSASDVGRARRVLLAAAAGGVGLSMLVARLWDAT